MAAIDPFVTADWLKANRRNPDIVIVDCRWYLDGPAPSVVYDAGRIAGAVLVDLDTDLSAPPGKEGGHPLPTPAQFAAAMRRIGVSDDSHVIAYDDFGGVIAGRLWWLLDSFGVQCSVLAGGFQSWDGPVDAGPHPRCAPGTFTERDFPKARFATADDVAGRGRDVLLVDSRAPARFKGEPGGDYPRYGHVPGAVNVYAYANFVDLQGWALHADETLQAQFARAGVAATDRPIITYCGSGVSACMNLLVLRKLGFENLSLYTGSFSEWGADYARPIEV